MTTPRPQPAAEAAGPHGREAVRLHGATPPVRAFEGAAPPLLHDLPAGGDTRAGTSGSDLADLVIDLTPELRERERRAPEPSPQRPHARTPAPGELARTAAIHASQLPGGFFVRFGPRFLAAYHGTFLSGPSATALVVGPRDVPTGFLVGTLDNARHYRWLVRNAGPMVGPGLVALTVRPALAHELLRTRAGRYLRSMIRLVRRRWAPEPPRPADARGTDAADGQRPPVVAVLTHVALTPAAQGAGAGRALVDAFVQQARDHGAAEIRLIAHVATPAPGFYRRLGWSSLGERTASDGTLVEEFQLVL